MEFRRSLVPSPATIIANREKNLSWEIVLGELIDNSFDAGATEVRLDFMPRELRASDNGRGASDTGVMLASGVREQHPGVTLGRYGVGLSDAAQWLGGQTKIATCDGSLFRYTTADWDKIAKQDHWPELVEYTRPADSALASGDLWSPTGTSIRFRHTRSYPSYDKLSAKLGFRYFPGLTTRKITLVTSRKPTQVMSFSPPRLFDNMCHEVSFEVDGKTVHAKGGMVADGEVNLFPGFHFVYDYRVVQTSEVPCDGYVTSRFYCVVTLGRDWPLSRNKDLITTDAEHEALLFGRLRSEFSFLMEACSAATLHLEVGALQQDLSRRLTNLLVTEDVRELRERGDTHGTHPAKGTPRKTAAARRTRFGTKTLKQPRVSKIAVEFVDGEGDELGYVMDSGSVLRIKLVKQFPAVAKAQRDGAAGAERLIYYAMMLAIPRMAEQRQRFLPGLADTDTLSAAITIASELVLKHDQANVRSRAPRLRAV